MDKNILKKFATESRQDLIKKIEIKLKTFYVDEEFYKEQKNDIYVLTNEKHSLNLTDNQYKKRELLVKRIKELSVEQVIEEAAYTWFNRIIAIRYMELNDMLPLTKNNSSLGIRVLSSKDNKADPEILKFTNLVNPDLDIKFNKVTYSKLKEEEKFEYVLLLICKKLGVVIPQVFDGITDYIDILIPDNLLSEAGIVNRLITEINESNFNQVEIIGWLYQYYISEKKDQVFFDLKKNIKISKENVPSATQLFTPDWVVKYLVNNSLGKTITDGEVANISNELEFYISNNLKTDKKDLSEIKFLDSCCGSGHILVYAFDVFATAYEKLGYSKDKIIKNIITKNIYGIDIDDRACQLSHLSLMLKACKYDRKTFSYGLIPNIISIQESNSLTNEVMDDLSDTAKEEYTNIKEAFLDAKEYGSLLRVPEYDFKTLKEELENIHNIFIMDTRGKTLPLIKQWNILSSKYDVVVTNPPYMGSRGMSPLLSEYVKKHFNNSKADMFAIFIEQVRYFCKDNGIYGMITQPSVLFLKSFECLRNQLLTEQTILSLLHMGRGIFGVDFGSTAFVVSNSVNEEHYGDYYRLHKRTFQYIDLEDIKDIFLNAIKDKDYTFVFENYQTDVVVEDDKDTNEETTKEALKIYYKVNQKDLLRIPGSPIAYWVSDSMLNAFKNKDLEQYAEIITGMTTGDNEKFLKLWYEVDYDKIAFDMKDQYDIEKRNEYFFPYSKGGSRRNWSGNFDYVVNWSLSSQFNRPKTTLRNLYFKKALTWPFVASGDFSARILPQGFMWDVAGSPCFVNDEKYFNYILGLLTTKITNNVLKLINPTINVQAIDLAKIPVIIAEDKVEEVTKLVDTNLELSKIDWDSFETSWEFRKHPLLESSTMSIEKIKSEEKNGFLVMNNLEEAFENWESICKQSFNQLKANESELNKIFIDIYGLKNELKPEVDDENVTISKADKTRDIKSLISYAVGCMFGRYSLDEAGLVYAGGTFDNSKYKTFKADIDNIIPITDEIYFADDIVGKFKTFLEVSYGRGTLNENIDFIAEALGKKGTETSEETIRRYFNNDFYNDHIKTYQKKPIYWLFDSGSKNGFKCLVYMHRYNDGLVAKVRLDYLHRIQTTYERLLNDISSRLSQEDLDITSKKEAQKQQIDLSGKLQETIEYDEKIAHIANQRINIDLDMGVTENYSKFVYTNPKTNKEESILGKI